MSLIAALIYWVIVVLWLGVFVTVAHAFIKNRATLGTSKLLLAVVAIDTVRNIVENVYFGAYFGSQYGFFAAGVGHLLGQPYLLILPKLLNVVAATVVILLLLYRWLPLAEREKARAARAIRKTSQALRREVQEHRRLFDTSLDLIVVTDRDRIIRRISKSCEAILGYRPEELIGQYGGNLVTKREIELVKTTVAKSIAGEAVIQNLECEFKHRDGHTVPIQISGVWSNHQQRLFLIGRDMTISKKAEHELKYLAHHDQLTQLPNRISLVRDLARRLDSDSASFFALVMLDLDGFKDVNDSLGHQLGDKLLRAVAYRLKSASEEREIYRLGGDEFVMVIDGSGLLDAADATQGVLALLTEPFQIDGHRMSIGASAGIALAPDHGSLTDELMTNVDLALYAAKAAGRARYCLYSPTMRAAAQAKLHIAEELRSAVENDEFELHFQPQIDLATGRVVGAEALLRWRHKERGLLAPGSFIDALSEGPHAAAVGRWILDTACEVAAKLRQSVPGFRVAVNLFPCQFTQEDLPRLIADTLAQAGLPAHSLEVEITENIVLGNEAVLKTLQEIRSMGVEIAFDDFGTGYASLSCVAAYPISRIKIDRSFIKNITHDSDASSTAIPSSIIAMAHSMQMSVTAEGIETEAQEAFLREKGCAEGQGFRYAPALKFEDLISYIAKENKLHALSA